jgi:hypothetical protein
MPDNVRLALKAELTTVIEMHRLLLDSPCSRVAVGSAETTDAFEKQDAAFWRTK